MTTEYIYLSQNGGAQVSLNLPSFYSLCLHLRCYWSNEKYSRTLLYNTKPSPSLRRTFSEETAGKRTGPSQPNHSVNLPSSPVTFCFSELTETEVLKKLTNLDTGKATGPDKISARHLRMAAPSITGSITALFSVRLATGHFPSE